MPNTHDVNEWFAITVSIGRKTGSDVVAEADIWRRDNQKSVGVTHYGQGRTLPAAERRALAAARDACPNRRPADWNSAKRH